MRRRFASSAAAVVVAAGGLILLPAAAAAAAPCPSRVVVDVSAAQVATLASAPVVLVPAPGAGAVVEVMHTSQEYTAGVDYPGGTFTVVVQYAGTSMQPLDYGMTIHPGGGDQVAYGNADVSGPWLGDMRGLAVELGAGSDPGGSSPAGTGTLKVTVDYEILGGSGCVAGGGGGDVNLAAFTGSALATVNQAYSLVLVIGALLVLGVGYSIAAGLRK